MSLGRRPSAATSSHTPGDTSSDELSRETVAAHGLTSLLRRASTTSQHRRVLTKAKPEDKMSSPRLPISTAEYNALPSSIQRKYFSSEERLAIAQQSAVEKRQRQSSKKSTSTTSSGKSSVLDVLPKRRKTFQKCHTQLQRRSSLPSAWNADGSETGSDTTWFDSLPDKVKRSQFSKQEIEAIDARKAQDLERPRTSSASKPAFDTVAWSAQPKLRQQASFHSPSVSISPSTCSNQTTHSAPHISASHSPLSSSVASDRYHTRSTPASPAIPALTVSAPREYSSAMKRPSLRRPFILQPIPLPPPILAPVSTLPSPETTSYIDLIKTLGPGSIASDIDEETTPTQEKEDARLNVTSVPPVWYDEKLNFDFEYHKPSLSTNASSGPRTMSPSISDAASMDTTGPVTPVSLAQVPQVDHTIRRVPSLPRPASSSTPDSIGHNQGITNFSHPQHLTHRDSSPRLRPSRSGRRHLVDGFYEDQQNQPYSITIHYSKDDPLALEALPVCDDLSGAHGAFAVQGEHHTSSFRKVLKVIRGH